MMNLSDDPARSVSGTTAANPAVQNGESAKDASYGFEYGEDGVYLHVDYEEAGGKPLPFEVLVYDLSRRNITGYSIVDLRLRTRRLDERIRLTDAREEPDADSDAIVYISRDEMSADLVLLPPCCAGHLKTADELLAMIQEKWGVVYGLDEAAVRRAVENAQYYDRIPIAAGTAPEKGEDGHLVFLFSTDRSYAPKIMEDGSADYKNLNVFEGVKEGAVLVNAIPPGEGKEGHTVKGVSLPAHRGADAKLPKGKNVRVSEDGLNLIAAKNGRVDYINGRVEISDVYRVPGDVDMGVGNIKFEGDVVVAGNVISGLTIEAAGMIEVRGYVEAGTLIAGGDIILKNGMQGMDKGRLCAGGNIVARFMERCEIEAQGSIFSDYIVQCRVTACGTITMKGKWGKIIGGEVRAGKGITANFVGSPSNELTVIELGASPNLRARCIRLEAQKNQLRAQLDKINSLARVIPSRTDNADRQEMRQKLIDAKDQLQQQYDATTAEIDALTQKLAEHSGARLHVFKTTYPNVKVIIDSCSTTTKSKIEFSTFLYREGEVVFTACEIRP